MHRSGANNASRRRTGLSIHYIAPHVHQVKLKEAAAATLVLGIDTYAHWREDSEPAVDFDPACIAAFNVTYGAYLAGTGKF